MAYSSIKKKMCKCGCGKWPSVSYKGYNASCAPQEVKDMVMGKRRSTKTASLKRISLKLRADNYAGKGISRPEEKVPRIALESFFDHVAKIIDLNPRCWECGKFIPKSFYRAASAHVLPKRKEYGFPSISANLDNYLVLGSGCGCHQKYDSSWEQAAKMKVWEKVVIKFKILYPLISPAEHKNIPDVLLQTLK